MFSEDYKRGVCLDDFDVGLDWNALIRLVDQVGAIIWLKRYLGLLPYVGK